MTEAVPISPEALREILRLHRLWLAGNPRGAQANLYNRDLRGERLEGVDLTRSLLAFVDLSAATLIRCTFDGAWMVNALMHQATLKLCKLRDTDLSGANLSYLSAERCDFSRANLRAHTLEHAKISDSALGGTVLEGLRINH